MHRPTFTQYLLANTWIGPWAQYLMSRTSFGPALAKVFGQRKPTPKDLDEFWFLANVNGGRHVFHKLLGYMQERETHKAR